MHTPSGQSPQLRVCCRVVSPPSPSKTYSLTSLHRVSRRIGVGRTLLQLVDLQCAKLKVREVRTSRGLNVFLGYKGFCSASNLKPINFFVRVLAPRAGSNSSLVRVFPLLLVLVPPFEALYMPLLSVVS